MTQTAYQIGLIGAQGYTGQALAKLLLAHPRAQLAATFGRTDAWDLSACLPELTTNTIPHYSITELEKHLDTLDFLFLATPTKASLELLTQLKTSPLPIIDLSGALRLPADVFSTWYSMTHPCPELIDTAIYGLQPWLNNKITLQPRLIANPGCYATCALMALLPLLQQRCIKSNNIIIDAKSGISGAGRSAKTELLFCELNQNFIPYKFGKHQHTPEIQHTLDTLTNTTTNVLLTTQLLPVTRGISMTIYAEVNSNTDLAAITDAYQTAYAHYPLVKFSELTHNRTHDDPIIALQSVVHSPRTHIGYTIQHQHLIVFASIDNLLKGAASQAIENFNAYYGLPLTVGLAAN